MTAVAEFERHHPERIPSVDLTAVLAAANETAEAISSGQRAIEIELAPGDSTAYRIVVTRPQRFITSSDRSYRHVGDGELLVTLLTPDVGAYVWGPGNSTWTDWGYVSEHWGCGEWTARVVAAFLNMLRDELAATAGVTS